MNFFERNQEGFIQFTHKVYEAYASVKPDVPLDWDALVVHAWVEGRPGVEEQFVVPRGVETPMFLEIWPIKRYTVWVENKFVEGVVQEDESVEEL